MSAHTVCKGTRLTRNASAGNDKLSIDIGVWATRSPNFLKLLVMTWHSHWLHHEHDPYKITFLCDFDVCGCQRRPKDVDDYGMTVDDHSDPMTPWPFLITQSTRDHLWFLCNSVPRFSTDMLQHVFLCHILIFVSLFFIILHASHNVNVNSKMSQLFYNS